MSDDAPPEAGVDDGASVAFESRDFPKRRARAGGVDAVGQGRAHICMASRRDGVARGKEACLGRLCLATAHHEAMILLIEPIPLFTLSQHA